MLLPFYWVTKPSEMSLLGKSVLVLLFSCVGVLIVPYALNLVAHLLPHFSAYLDGGNRLVSGHGYRNAIEMGFGFLSVFILGQLFR